MGRPRKLEGPALSKLRALQAALGKNQSELAAQRLRTLAHATGLSPEAVITRYLSDTQQQTQARLALAAASHGG